MPIDDVNDRRKTERNNATLRLTFTYAGRRFVAITTSVSSHGATVVAPVQLPKGAMIVFEALETKGATTESGEPVKLIAQVVWTGPAPFGSNQAFSAGLQLLRASAGSWEQLLSFVRDHIQPDIEVTTTRLAEKPAMDLRESAAPDSEPGRFEVLFNAGDVWLRGELIHANDSTLWIATRGMTPRPDAPMQARIGIRSTKGRAAVLIQGRVPSSPIADHRGRGWIFECHIETLNRQDLFDRLLVAVTDKGTVKA
jgi:hypothetical protein